jgi:hypothetical protein
MNENEYEELRHLLKQSLQPMKSELEQDLWPRMLRRFDTQSIGSPWFVVLFSSATLSRVPWFDWALLAALILGVCVFPRSIPIWLYHF